MEYINGFRQFRKVFFKTRVFAFILTGIGFMFLTFLTNKNAMELGIAAIGSIFIGIGVNNFTAIESEEKDNKKLNHKTQDVIKSLHHINSKIGRIKELALTNPQLAISEIELLSDYIDLCVQSQNVK